MDFFFSISTYTDHSLQTWHQFSPENAILLYSGINFLPTRIAFKNFEISRHAKSNDVNVLNNLIPEDDFIDVFYDPMSNSIHD